MHWLKCPLNTVIKGSISYKVTSRPEPCVGSSSRLHHDYHDNLYILLRGRKRFRLFPPSMARRMYTHGQIRTVHPNGRIVYEGQVRLLPRLAHPLRPYKVWRARSTALCNYHEGSCKCQADCMHLSWWDLSMAEKPEPGVLVRRISCGYASLRYAFIGK